MIITHKNTGTLGDFVTQLPLISALKDRGEYIHLSLPAPYQHFNGLSKFLLHQTFIDEVDFLDTNGDLDIQAHLCDAPRPCRARYTANKLGIDIDDNLKLSCPHIDLSHEYKNKPIIIDKNTPNNNRPIMKNSGLFPESQYLYLVFDPIQDIIFNINVCLQNPYRIFGCLTGLSVLLQYFDNVKLSIVWFNKQDQENLGIVFYGESEPFYETYFDKPNINLIYWKDLVV